MAIDEPAYQDAGNYVQPHKRFWPLRIPVSHWQLRHYLSNPEPNQLYYASSREVYCLDTTTKKRRLIAILPFDARCTASGYGWVCVGGEKEGHFASIKLDGSGPRSEEVDSALSISALRSSRHTPSVKIERIGEEIVNSISVHHITDEATCLDDVVAVLTNNDHTVRIYSLPQNRVTAVLKLPHAMNHATISADGSMMVAVGDFNQAYFYARHIQDDLSHTRKTHERLRSDSIDWKLIQVCDLHATDPDLTVGYFTTAWSPDGKHVAVGSEGGYITVFDVQSLRDSDFDDRDAVVVTIPGSRPDLPIPYVGAVRSMIFSPAPWDLLIWAEDQGRVCVGDVRGGLQRKQVLELDPKGPDLELVQVEDALTEGASQDEIEQLLQASQRNLDDLESDFLRRYGSGQDNATAVNFATEYVDARRRQRHQRMISADNPRRTTTAAATAVPDEPRGLTAHEHQILDSLRTTRQREEARVGGRATNVNYTSSDTVNPPSTTAVTSTSTSDTTNRPLTDIMNTVHELFPELARSTAWSRRAPSYDSDYLSPISVPGDALSWSNTRYNALASDNSSNAAGEMRRMLELRIPRRQASIVATPPEIASDTNAADPVPTTALGGVVTAHGHLTPATSHDEADDEQNPWRTIEEAMASARSPLLESTARVPARSPVAASTPDPARTLAARMMTDRADERADRADRIQSLARQRERLRLSRREALTRLSGASATSSATRPQFDLSLDSYDIVSRHMAGSFAATYGGPQVGVRTAGLAMSKDGRTLWVACEDGIFEFLMNRKERMFWPSVRLR